jgi:transcriptional regulator with XRE-family HTH domain
MDTAESPFQPFEVRRQQLGMSYSALARRGGVSEATVRRVLSGHHEASFANVKAIAEALGMGVKIDAAIDIEDLRTQQALLKARRLARMVQATSGLEGQAVNEETVRQMETRTLHELLAGPPRRLWSE